MKTVYFVTYPTTKPWGSNFFSDNLSRHSVNNVIEITPKQSTKICNSVLFYHNVQTIPKNFMGRLGVKALKRRGNTVIAGFRGHIGFDKWKEIIPELDHVVCNIDSSLVAKVKHETDNYTVFYPGADPKTFKPMDIKKTHVLSWMGRDHKTFKNSELLSQLGHSYAKATYSQYIPHDEVPAFLNRSKIHVVTSDHEGFCRGALEAALCGIPVVGPKIGVIPKIICYWCVIDGSPREKVSQYRKIINFMLTNKELMCTIAENNRTKALWFTWEHSAMVFDKIIAEQTG